MQEFIISYAILIEKYRYKMRECSTLSMKILGHILPQRLAHK